MTCKQRGVYGLLALAEPAEVLARYGAGPGKASFANSCLLARGLAERDLRFIQIYHRDWDHHNNLPADISRQWLIPRPILEYLNTG